jgi:transposase-like protein
VLRFTPLPAAAARPCRHSVGNIITDQAPAHPVVLEELLPAAWHRTEQYGNNRVEADHGRLKARLRPMRGLKDRSARVVVVMQLGILDGGAFW